MRWKRKLSYISCIKLPTAHLSWKLFSGRFINAVMTAHASSIAKYGHVAINNNFTHSSGIEQYAWTNSVWKHSFKNFQIHLSFELTGRSVIWTNYFYYFSFHIRRHCQDEDSNTLLRKLTWLKRSACPKRWNDQFTVRKNGDWFCLQSFSCQK